MSETMNIIFRTMTAFFLMLVITRITGRRMVAQLRFHDLITATMLGTLAGNLAFNIKIESRIFVLSMIVLGIITLVLIVFEMRSRKARQWIEGKAVTVIENGEILKEAMEKHKFTEDLLLQQLRLEQVFDPNEVEKAILEKGGQISVLKKKEYRPLTVSSFREAAEGCAAELIVDGKLLKTQLHLHGLTEYRLGEEAAKQGYRLEDIRYAVKGTDGRLYFVPSRLSAPEPSWNRSQSISHH